MITQNLSNVLHTVHHNKDSSGISKEIESYIEKTVDWIDDRISLNGKCILDCGCDYGHLLKSCIDKGASGIGIDPYHTHNPYNLSILKEDMCDPLLDKKIGSHFKSSFNLIVFNHSLEHVYNPYLAIKNAQLLLDKEGYIFLGLPRCEHDWAYWEGHYSIWNEKWATQFMSLNGFTLVHEKKDICFRKDNVEFWQLFKRTTNV